MKNNKNLSVICNKKRKSEKNAEYIYIVITVWQVIQRGGTTCRYGKILNGWNVRL